MNGTATSIKRSVPALLTCALAAAWLAPAHAQVNDSYRETAYQDDRYEPYDGDYEYADGATDVVMFTPDELVDLVGPIALYPDDLLAIALPASAYPLQIDEAVRFLDDYERNPSLQPPEDWEDSVVALLNYPEVLQLMHDDPDWTWSLGAAVMNQQQDVLEAVEEFRDQAYIAGNLRSDRYQTVDRAGETISIRPANEQVIYVPYYEPRRVIVYQTRPAFAYHPRPRPIYYYPYHSDYAFYRGLFWGVTTAYGIAWSSHDLRVYHHSYRGHPYYGRRYIGRYYRQPSIHRHDAWYAHNARLRASYRHRYGDVWRPRHRTGARPRVVRTRPRNDVVRAPSQYRQRTHSRHDAGDLQRSDRRVRRRSDVANDRDRAEQRRLRQRAVETANAERPQQRSQPASTTRRPDTRRTARPARTDDATARHGRYRDRVQSNVSDGQSRRTRAVTAGTSRSHRAQMERETSATRRTHRADTPRRSRPDRDADRQQRRQQASGSAQRRDTGKPARRGDTRKDRDNKPRNGHSQSRGDKKPAANRKGRARD